MLACVQTLVLIYKAQHFRHLVSLMKAFNPFNTKT